MHGSRRKSTEVGGHNPLTCTLYLKIEICGVTVGAQERSWARLHAVYAESRWKEEISGTAYCLL